MKTAEIIRFPLFSGANDVTRTHDLLITNQLLYRLSYISIFTFGVADLILTNQLLYRLSYTSASIQMRVRVYHKVFYSSSNFPNFLKAACRTTIHIGQVKK